ncbi:hypothetical protein AVEN_77481-1 [Araneus ventricosus]|uniref:Uncharacterized protein n=1 Tax=Araneus ventricosus TaxID=182803 RepID=A0A4Y2NG74_ARAVE|nr:hypothetical protein AVEN_77481-1 [Araneus ventricosus]
MTRTTPELAPPLQSSAPHQRVSPLVLSRPYTLLGRPASVGIFAPTGGRLATTCDLACSRPHTQRIFSGIGFGTWDPPAPRPRPYH